MKAPNGLGPANGGRTLPPAANLSRWRSRNLSSFDLDRLRLRLHLVLDDRLRQLGLRDDPCPESYHGESLETASGLVELAEIEAELRALSEGRRADTARLLNLSSDVRPGQRSRPQTQEEYARETRAFFGF